MSPSPFDKIVTKPDRLTINDVVFRLEYGKDDSTWDGGDQFFLLYKGPGILLNYRRLFERNPSLTFDNFLELGIYESGSIAFWNELFNPKKFSALDNRQPFSSPYADAYFERIGKERPIRLHWDFDQSDRERLERLIADDFGDAPLDIVIDDASHLPVPTLASFETLFPIVRPGGVYIIEDWNWNHARSHQDDDHMWVDEVSPSELVFELLEAVGSNNGMGVDHVEICTNFIALFRDTSKLPSDYQLSNYVRRRAKPYSWFNRRPSTQ